MNTTSDKKQYKLTEQKYVIPFVMITVLFFLWGFARAILDVLNKHLQNELGITITQSALIQVTTYLGYFLMAIPSGLFISRFGYRKGVVLGLILFAIGAFSFIPGVYVGGFNIFLLALFIIGCGLTFLETAANPYVTELGLPQTATSRLNLSQSFNGLGSLFATSIVGLFFFRETSFSHTEVVSRVGDVFVPYVILGIIVLLIAFLFSRVELPEIPHNDNLHNESLGKSLTQLFKFKSFTFGLTALLAYEIAEISINSYFINFVTGMNWMSDSTASLLLTLALGFFMVGRFLGSYIMKRIDPKRVLALCGVGSALCCLVVLLNQNITSMVALLGIYLFEAIMFPTIFSLALQNLGGLTKRASSLLMMTPIGGCGFLLMGYLADHTNHTIPFILPLIGFCIVACYSFFLNKK